MGLCGGGQAFAAPGASGGCAGIDAKVSPHLGRASDSLAQVQLCFLAALAAAPMSESDFNTLSVILLGGFSLVATVVAMRVGYTAGRSEGYRAGFEASSSFPEPSPSDE